MGRTSSHSSLCIPAKPPLNSDASRLPIPVKSAAVSPRTALLKPRIDLQIFFLPNYEKVRAETLESRVLLADETVHRMLEGDEKDRWFLWAFSDEASCFFECHDTRSGDVASAVLAESQCEVPVSDVYSGYAKAVKDASVPVRA
jgi:hypothetical protein